MPGVSTVLLLDDDPDGLQLVSDLLSQRLQANVTSTRFPSEAIHLAAERFFDLVILDVTLNYRGSPFGGLDVYGELLHRYGTESLVAYSEVITDMILRNYPFVHNFVDKHRSPVSFADELARLALQLRAKQTAFVAIPFAPCYQELYSVIARSVAEAGYVPVRVDQQDFTASILDQILLEIRRAKIVVFVATDRNPNAFYECGHAVALGKEVVTVTDNLAELPFDVRDRNAIVYGKNVAQLGEQLTKRLRGLSSCR